MRNLPIISWNYNIPTGSFYFWSWFLLLWFPEGRILGSADSRWLLQHLNLAGCLWLMNSHWDNRRRNNWKCCTCCSLIHSVSVKCLHYICNDANQSHDKNGTQKKDPDDYVEDIRKRNCRENYVSDVDAVRVRAKLVRLYNNLKMLSHGQTGLMHVLQHIKPNYTCTYVWQDEKSWSNMLIGI